MKYGLSISGAEELAGFEVRVPVSLPKGYRLKDAAYNSGSGIVVQHYAFHPTHAGEGFFLVQGRSQPGDVIGPDAAVETVKIGDTIGEFVQGSWGIGAEANQAVMSKLTRSSCTMV